uniref:Uncharacterized protein n=1 Tax=Chromera velia CCMP2878 TaxID=1169474 RepID=A0A0G4GVN4_9ALVE|eukprot:Cvel_23581.t1-p1 / transcript=Cvel_23581.t1 / gene=Cvel_23581 / organism=Chromera_velia_CCMP2878 / gene_product=hypothetical protein / transcript_product=hypothetical protein / location=Cvel_scaffold2447:19768-22890(-) / protein_length=694 / sequence_SO=supercontig / SO=protein_coding / is_pseudo=false
MRLREFPFHALKEGLASFLEQTRLPSDMYMKGVHYAETEAASAASSFTSLFQFHSEHHQGAEGGGDTQQQQSIQMGSMKVAHIGVAFGFLACITAAVGDNMIRKSFVLEQAKTPSNRRPVWRRPMWLWGIFWANVVNAVLTSVSLGFTTASVITSMSGIHLFLDVLFAHFFLGEQLSTAGLASASVIMIGVVLVVGYGPTDPPPLPNTFTITPQIGVYMGVVTVLVAVTLVGGQILTDCWRTFAFKQPPHGQQGALSSSSQQKERESGSAEGTVVRRTQMHHGGYAETGSGRRDSIESSAGGGGRLSLSHTHSTGGSTGAGRGGTRDRDRGGEQKTERDINRRSSSNNAHANHGPHGIFRPNLEGPESDEESRRGLSLSHSGDVWGTGAPHSHTMERDRGGPATRLSTSSSETDGSQDLSSSGFVPLTMRDKLALVCVASLYGLMGANATFAAKAAIWMLNRAIRGETDVWASPLMWGLWGLTILLCLSQIFSNSKALSNFPAVYAVPVGMSVLILTGAVGGEVIFNERAGDSSLYAMGALLSILGIVLLAYTHEHDVQEADKIISYKTKRAARNRRKRRASSLLYHSHGHGHKGSFQEGGLYKGGNRKLSSHQQPHAQGPSGWPWETSAPDRRPSIHSQGHGMPLPSAQGATGAGGPLVSSTGDSEWGPPGGVGGVHGHGQGERGSLGGRGSR